MASITPSSDIIAVRLQKLGCMGTTTQISPAIKKPLQFLPDGGIGDFLLNKFVGISYVYSNKKPLISKASLEWATFGNRTLRKIVENDNNIWSLHNAFVDYQIRGKSGIFFGSVNPDAAEVAIKHEVGHIKFLALEAYKIPKAFEKVAEITDYESFTETNISEFDFAASYYSIAQLGLGSYGEPVDAFWDFRILSIIKCAIKPGALVYLGIPIGIDGIVFNEYRIYGSIRLAMLIAGFDWIATYSPEEDGNIEVTGEFLYSIPKFTYKIRTIVLKKRI
ncbi:unnamed protein product [Caenorhabditis bovis]|uniref:Uncharacterized protein n=1 Tax=Caenorhabditis bovis TaxID=2654633 RepID=A0A8S1EH93_9PELO|nr:unnamed protein product [Caenorhabditis bovis]